MSKKAAAPAKIKDTATIEGMVLEWFERENKPVTAQSLTDALGSRISKPLIHKALEALYAQEKLRVKDLKKVRFFFLRIDTAAAPTPADTPEPIASHPSEPSAVDEEEVLKKVALVDSLMQATQDIKDRGAVLQQLQRQPTTQERADKCGLLEVEVESLEHRVAEASTRASGGSGSVCETQSVVRAYLRTRQLWKERKEHAQRIIDAVLGDAYSKDELVDLFDITTDEAMGASMAASAVALPRSLIPKD